MVLKFAPRPSAAFFERSVPISASADASYPFTASCEAAYVSGMIFSNESAIPSFLSAPSQPYVFTKSVSTSSALLMI